MKKAGAAKILTIIFFFRSVVVSDFAEGGHGLDRKSSIIWPILHHLLPIMVKLFISSAKTEEETLRKTFAK